MFNVGCVLYKKGDALGTLDATWCHPYFGKGILGTGNATGGPDEGYAGRYDIRYFDGKGNELPVLKLDIQKDGDYYEIAWIDDGEVVYRGIGMEVAEGLVAGWRGIDDKPPQPFETQA